MAGSSVLFNSSLGGRPKRQGKVRDLYDLGSELLLVACDRISAFDVVLPTPIPGKGELLTRISKFWFERLQHLTAHHLIRVIGGDPPAGLEQFAEQLNGRAMLCHKCQPLPIEFVVRGYLAGSAWQDYRRSGTHCGIRLPSGLVQCQQLPEPIFTPATKADTGHDENISFDEACHRVGRPIMEDLRDRSLALYAEGAAYARQRGVIIADTKFEWGRLGDRYVLIDEVLTPDSSRFWPADQYAPGRDQDSFDKQYVRNYLQDLCDRGQWDKTPPGPQLPAEVVANTRRKYEEVYTRLCR